MQRACNMESRNILKTDQDEQPKTSPDHAPVEFPDDAEDEQDERDRSKQGNERPMIFPKFRIPEQSHSGQIYLHNDTDQKYERKDGIRRAVIFHSGRLLFNRFNVQCSSSFHQM